MIRKTLSVLLLLSAIAGKTQVLYPDSYLVDYNKLLELQNDSLRKRIMVNTANVSPNEYDRTPEWNAWGDHYQIYRGGESRFSVLPVISSFGFNSKYPRSYNDGPVWRGKGMNADINFGFRGHFGMLHYTFAPVVYYAQNKDYPRPNGVTNDFGYPYSSRIDWVQQYGTEAVTKFHMGQSDLRLIYKKLTLGVSTQNVVLGPSQVNPIIMSNNAAMFPHIDFGTDTPIETVIGDFEFRSYWGIMNESDYFDDNDRNNQRYFQGGGAYYRPSFLPGLSVGATRIHYRDWKIQKFALSDVFLSFADFSSNKDSLSSGSVVNDVYDQMVAINLKWTFEEVGFETYLEFAKNDFSNIRALATEPEHSRAYTIGFIKVFDLGDNKAVKATYEHTTLGQTRLIKLRFSPPYYLHHLAPQGYTQGGQLLGAGIGPGSNGDVLMVNYYFPQGMYGMSLQRIRFNDDYAFGTFDPNGDRPFDMEYSATLKALRFVSDFSVGAELSLSNRLNWQYIKDNDVNNLYFRFVLGYQLTNLAKQ